MATRVRSPIAQAIEVPIALDTPEYQLAGLLLGTLAKPPTMPGDPLWEKSVAAFRYYGLTQRAAHDPAWGRSPQQIVPAHFVMASDEVHRQMNRGRRGIETSLLAVHAIKAEIDRIEAQMRRPTPDPANRRFHDARSMNSEIDRVLAQEIELEAFMAARGRPKQPRRAQEFTETPSAQSNFSNRVLRPNRPVLHLALAFAQILDLSSRTLGRQLGGPEAWEARGFVSRPAGSVESGAVLPMVPWEIIFLVPEVARRSFELAQLKEPPVENFLVDTVRPVPAVHFRFV